MSLTKNRMFELMAAEEALAAIPIEVRIQWAVDERISELARQGAAARHSDTDAIKADVFVWLDANMPNFKSMDAAAQAITRQQPIAFRTARKWLGDWKKLRSASKP